MLPSVRHPGNGPLCLALGGFFLWTAATWLLEGRIQTLLRPDAMFDRLLYTGIANIAVGQVGAFALLALLLRWTGTEPAAPRSRPLGSRPICLIAAGLLGLGYFVAAGAEAGNAVVTSNAFAQVLVVSAAEVIVCWALVGLSAECSFRPLGRNGSSVGAACAASLAFAGYHFAHSPPFNTPSMVAFLTIVGLITSVFFFVTRDLVATIVFHNFPAAAGVTRALAEQGELGALSRPQPVLLATAAVCLLVVLAGERLVLANRS